MRLLIALLVAAIFTSCKKEGTAVDAGNVALHVYVKHHDIPIGNSRLFVKNGTLTFPGYDTTLYDARYVTDANGYFKLSDIGNGKKDMVIYAKGIDQSWDATGTTPVWGFNTISFKTSPGEDDERTITIAVSE